MNFLLVLLVAVLVLFTIWCIASYCNIIKSDEVGIRCFFGKPEPVVRYSGLVFIPKFPGVDLVRIPRKIFKLSYEVSKEHAVYTKDGQLVFPEVSFFMEFPYDEADSLVQIIRSGVPLTEEGLREWAEDILIPALRKVFQKKLHTELIGDADIDSINNDVNTILDAPDSVLRACRVTGRDVSVELPGTGRAYVEVEVIRLTDELQEAMQSKVKQSYLADAARETARRNAEEVGGQVLGIVARKHGLTVEALEKDLKKDPKKAGIPVADGGYKESFAFAEDQTKRDRAANSGDFTDIRIGNSDGSSMSGELPAFAAAALLLNRGGGKGGGGGDKKGNRDGGDAILKEDPTTLSPERLAEYKQAVINRKRHG
ncbi:MAG: SPFH domain-containing protein [Candidatus Staskawiczbacteria bacterium]|nr:SPFH domain-containing protein [Candidatus Staskawiczbacteria bacterium]